MVRVDLDIFGDSSKLILKLDMFILLLIVSFFLILEDWLVKLLKMNVLYLNVLFNLILVVDICGVDIIVVSIVV